MSENNKEPKCTEMSQETLNSHAILATKTLAMLCGFVNGTLKTEPNIQLWNAIKNILTEPIAMMLQSNNAIEILNSLNVVSASPMRLWDSKMRQELYAFATKMEIENDTKTCLDLEYELKVANSFEYSNLSDEISIGGVYIRIFNDLGGGREAIREIPDCSKFACSLLMFISKTLESSLDELCLIKRHINIYTGPKYIRKITRESLSKGNQCSVRDTKFTMVVKSLHLLARLDGLVDDAMCGDNGSSILLRLLELPHDCDAFEFGSLLLLSLSSKQSFADSVASNRSLLRLLLSLETLNADDEADETDETFDMLENNVSTNNVTTHDHLKWMEHGWDIFESLASSQSVSSLLLESSGWLELVGILAGYKDFTKTWIARKGAVNVLSRLLWDPNTSQYAAPLLQRFLPNALTDIMKDNGSEKFLSIFDGENETPELIWDLGMRAELRYEVALLLDPLMTNPQKERGMFMIPHGYQVKYTKLEKEPSVGGIYVRLFLKEPTFKLTDPNRFLEMMLSRWSQDLDNIISNSCSSKENDDYELLTTASQDTLELVTSGIIFLCKNHSHLCDNLAQWGYVPSALAFLHRTCSLNLRGTPMVSTLKVIHQASTRTCNIKALATLSDLNGKMGIVDGIMKACGNGKLHRELSLMVETLKFIFNFVVGGKISENHQLLTLDTANPSPLEQKGRVESKLSSSFRSTVAAPSPAPGIEPVNKLKDALDDHPLAMVFDSSPPSSTSLAPCVDPPVRGMNQSHLRAQKQALGISKVKKLTKNTSGILHHDNASVPNNDTHFMHGHKNSIISTSAVSKHSSTRMNQSKNHDSKQINNFQFNQSSNIQKPIQIKQSIQNQSTTPDSCRLQNQNHYIPVSDLSQQFLLKGHNVIPMPISNIIKTHNNTQINEISRTQENYGNDTCEVNKVKIEQLQQNLSSSNIPIFQTQQHHQNPNSFFNQTSSNRQHFLSKGQNAITATFSSDVTQNHNIVNQDRSTNINVYNTHINDTSPQQNLVPLAPPPSGAPPPPPMPINVKSNQKSPQKNTVEFEVPKTADQMIVNKVKEQSDHITESEKERETLILSAIKCKLPEFLILEVLENPSLKYVREPSCVQVHVVELLHLFLKDPFYGSKFKMILDAIPTWKKYKSRDFSSFISSTENISEYLSNVEKSSVSQPLLNVDT